MSSMVEQLVLLFSSLRGIFKNYVCVVILIVKDLYLIKNTFLEVFSSFTSPLKTSSFSLRYPSQQRGKLLR